MKKKLPPTSTRYCACCKNETTFKYDRNIGHSRCIECGWHYIPTLDVNGAYDKEKEEFYKVREEKKATPEYQEKKKREDEQKQKLKEIQMLALSKEALEYRERCRRRNELKTQINKRIPEEI